MVKNKSDVKSGVTLQDPAELALMETVEGTFQCMGCQRFMRLGEGKLCMSFEGDAPVIAEIVGWVPGLCERYLEAEKLFPV